MDDIKKMWYNAYSYNPKDTPIYLITVQMDKYFDKLLKDDNIPIPTLEVLPPPPIRGKIFKIQKLSPNQDLSPEKKYPLRTSSAIFLSQCNKKEILFL